jgi:hypothetical protein
MSNLYSLHAGVEKNCRATFSHRPAILKRVRGVASELAFYEILLPLEIGQTTYSFLKITVFMG